MVGFSLSSLLSIALLISAFKLVQEHKICSLIDYLKSTPSDSDIVNILCLRKAIVQQMPIR